MPSLRKRPWLCLTVKPWLASQWQRPAVSIVWFHFQTGDTTFDTVHWTGHFSRIHCLLPFNLLRYCLPVSGSSVDKQWTSSTFESAPTQLAFGQWKLLHRLLLVTASEVQCIFTQTCTINFASSAPSILCNFLRQFNRWHVKIAAITVFAVRKKFRIVNGKRNQILVARIDMKYGWVLFTWVVFQVQYGDDSGFSWFYSSWHLFKWRELK